MKSSQMKELYWQKLIGCILFCLISISGLAQTSNEQLKTLEADIKIYEQATNHIVKEGKAREGIAELTALIDKREKMAGYSLTMLASYYSCREQGWLRLKEYQHAIDDGNTALSLLTKAGNEGKKDLSSLWYKQSLAYYYWGKPEETMEAASQCIKTALDYYGPLHSETLEAYSLRSNYAGFYNNKKQAMQDRQKCFEIISNNVKQNFTYLTSSERTSYWNKYQPETAAMFTFAHKLNIWQSDFTDDLYNQQLLAKGLLLTTETALQRAIDQDANLSASYQKIRQLRKQATETRNDNALIEAERLERSLGTSASALYQFMDFLKVSVADVRAKLQVNDIAVEFVDYRVGKDSVMYAALVLSPQWQHVRFIPLVEAREIPQLQDNLTNKIWKPILDAAGGNIKKIYFSPTGLLYQLPIESQLLPNGLSMGEAYQLFRLSSTRWLALNDNTERGKDAVVYGGLAYDTSITELQQDAKQYPQTRPTSPVEHKKRAALSGLTYLPATKTEAETIAKTLNATMKKDLHANLLLGKQGTEASFKSLDGLRKQIVHIATHGFYDDDKSASATDALSRCGLYFAGADNRLQGEQIPKDTDDGILTAQEISSLDLRGLSLIALSACQTGEGEITGDGVFGLQRGFKKAGAQSLLMSLWPVDDEATCLLMTEFYSNWLSGKTKHDALELAKQTVRSHKEKGWDKPEFWAAFILLDALD